MDIIKVNKKTHGVRSLCNAFKMPKSTYYRLAEKIKNTQNESKKPMPTSPRKITEEERQQVIELCNKEENIDKSISQIYCEALDAGLFICSSSSFYRILVAEGATIERRKQRKQGEYKKPELIATRPNQVWSWDTSKLKGPKKMEYFYLYTVIDIYSRYVVAWTVASVESAKIAEELFEKAFKEQKVLPETLIIHSDNGQVMKSIKLNELYESAGVKPSFNRPYVSNDNPFSEAHFKTVKYTHSYPERFIDLKQAQKFLEDFYIWYNEKKYHSGIKMLTPSDVHYGGQVSTIAKRQAVIQRAKEKHPERFLGKKGNVCIFNEPVYINKPKILAG